MLVPGKKLMFWIAALLPFVVMGALVESVLPFVIGAFVLLFIISVLDAVLVRGLARLVTIELPDVVRMSKDKEDEFPLTISTVGNKVSLVTIGIPFPQTVHLEEESIEVALPEESEVSNVSWPCLPQARGSYMINKCYYMVTSPFLLWDLRTEAECDCELRIYPNLLGERKRLSGLFLNRENAGMHVQRVIGQGRDFEKLREYIPGDSYDEIHWKATAKRGKPITKLFQVERTQEIYVILDTSRLSGRLSGEETNLEQFLRSALIMGLVAERQGDLFGLATFNSRVRTFIRAGGGKNHFNVCRDALYSLMPSTETPDYDELFTFMRLNIRRRALVLILTDLADPMLSESFMRNIDLVCKKHIVMVSMIRQNGIDRLFSAEEVDSLDMIYEKLGGHITWRALMEVSRQLQHRGVKLSLTNRDDLSVDLVSQYMSVKSRQML